MQREHQIVRFKAGGVTFEVLTKLGSVLKYRSKQLGWNDVLFHEEIFRNFSKAEKAKGSDLKEAFGTEDIQECAKIIVEKGELQLTAQERKEFLERKRAEIINYICKYYIDPRSKTPHPPARVEAALEELNIRVNPAATTEKQVQDIAKRLPEVLPIKRQEVEGTLTIPNKHIGACAGVIAKYVKVKNEKYSEGECTMEVALVPGDYNSLLSDLNRITKGEFQFEVDGAQMSATSEDDQPTKKKAGGRRGKK